MQISAAKSSFSLWDIIKALTCRYSSTRHLYNCISYLEWKNLSTYLCMPIRQPKICRGASPTTCTQRMLSRRRNTERINIPFFEPCRDALEVSKYRRNRGTRMKGGPENASGCSPQRKGDRVFRANVNSDRRRVLIIGKATTRPFKWYTIHPLVMKTRISDGISVI